jgi:adenylate kinase family enzyme
MEINAPQKIMIIGSPGSGKSTLARALRDISGLPLWHLDMIWHRPDGSDIGREAFDRELSRLVAGDRWIIDGNYARTLEVRLEACDTVILLDLPVEECLRGAYARVGVKREDMPWVERELDPEFAEFIRDFPQTTLPKIYALLERYSHKRTVILKSREEIDRYVERCQRDVRIYNV